MNDVIIYSDGSCINNPGPGAYASIVIYHDEYGEEKEMQFVEGSPHTTNNEMELSGVLRGLKSMPPDSKHITVYTDSSYVVDGFNKHWLDNWFYNDWRTSANKPIKNKMLWLELYIYSLKYDIDFVWVKGHADNEYNNRCDKLANDMAMKFRHKYK
jgi:ribonuclease HI